MAHKCYSALAMVYTLACEGMYDEYMYVDFDAVLFALLRYLQCLSFFFFPSFLIFFLVSSFFLSFFFFFSFLSLLLFLSSFSRNRVHFSFVFFAIYTQVAELLDACIRARSRKRSSHSNHFLRCAKL